MTPFSKISVGLAGGLFLIGLGIHAIINAKKTQQHFRDNYPLAEKSFLKPFISVQQGKLAIVNTVIAGLLTASMGIVILWATFQ